MERPLIGITMAHLVPSGEEPNPIEAVRWNFTHLVHKSRGLALGIFNDYTPQIAEEYLNTVHGLIFTGGGDINPSRYLQDTNGAGERAQSINELRDTMEFALIAGAIDRGIPILGICRGHQLLNVARGGDLKQHMLSNEHMHPQLNTYSGLATTTHEIQFLTQSRFFEDTQTLTVNSAHHQCIDRLGKHLKVSATHTDGTIEAIESDTDAWQVGVQWHPEAMPDSQFTKHLFTEFINASREFAVNRITPELHLTHTSA